MRDSVFSTYHPVIEFGFFCAVIGIGMFMIHPVFLAFGASAAFIYALITGGKGSLRFTLYFLVPMIFLVLIINPLVNHRGSTILIQLEYSYITAEAVVYGLMMGLMLAAILLWFRSYNRIMTSDKFTYLFGRIMPSISLLFTMVMRFIPNYKKQISRIAQAQQGLHAGGVQTEEGEDVVQSKPETKRPWRERVHEGIRIISTMFTWALENSIDSADSMRSRGYGLKNRTTFSIYRFDRRDGAAGVFLLVMTLITLISCLGGACHVEYYPEFIMGGGDGLLAGSTAWRWAGYGAFALICYFPVFIEAKEALVWRHLESKI